MPLDRVKCSVVVTTLFALVTGCSEPTNSPLNTPPTPEFAKSVASVVVNTTTPYQAPRDTTLDVQVSGSGFETGARADWLLHGVSDSRVRTNSTRFVSSTLLVANITISGDAEPSSYDVAVTTLSGKKGIGTDLFTVGISVSDLAAGTGLYGRALHINAQGFVLGSLGSDPISPKGFGYWGPSSATFSIIDATATMTTLGKGNSPGDWAEHFNFPRVWLISGESSWSPVTLRPLGSVAVIPNAINASRVVVGRSASGPLRWENPYADPVLLPLPAISGLDVSSANAWGINAVGDIVGSVSATTGKSYALLWTNNGLTASTLPLAPGASGARATGINDGGVIVGFSIASGGNSYPMRWTPNGSGYTISTLTTSTGNNLAGSINSCGQAVGSISAKGYVWGASGAVTLLPLPAGASEAIATAVNDAGVVVGEAKFVSKGKSYYKPIRWTGLVGC